MASGLNIFRGGIAPFYRGRQYAQEDQMRRNQLEQEAFGIDRLRQLHNFESQLSQDPAFQDLPDAPQFNTPQAPATSQGPANIAPPSQAPTAGVRPPVAAQRQDNVPEVSFSELNDVGLGYRGLPPPAVPEEQMNSSQRSAYNGLRNAYRRVLSGRAGGEVYRRALDVAYRTGALARPQVTQDYTQDPLEGVRSYPENNPGQQTTQPNNGLAQAGVRATGMTSESVAAQIPQVIPGSVVSSGRRSRQHNAEVGGVPNSQHMSGTAIDFVLPEGTPFNEQQVRSQLAQIGLGNAEVINEGDHVHVEWGTTSPQGSAPTNDSAPTGQIFAAVQSAPDQAPGIIQMLQQQREEQARLYGLAVRTRNIPMALELRQRVRDLDLQTATTFAATALQDFNMSGNPGGIAAYLTWMTGREHSFAGENGTYTHYVDGQQQSEPASRAEIADEFRLTIDQEYQNQRSEAYQEMQQSLFEGQMQYQRETDVARIRGLSDLAVAQLRAQVEIQNGGRDPQVVELANGGAIMTYNDPVTRQPMFRQIMPAGRSPGSNTDSGALTLGPPQAIRGQ